MYKDSEYEQFIDHLKSGKAYHLALFIGLYENNKQKALKEIAKATGKEVLEYDFDDIVSKIERDTVDAVDQLWEEVKDSDAILHFSNGDKLCGAYTGFSHSKVKYATPQERYFLQKIQAFQGLVIIDITEYDSADETILRAADSIIKFPLPSSSLQRFWWHLKHYSLHGFDLKTKRPESYLDTSTNF
ncbi:hypothetical protein ACG2F4_18180 [Halalkalibaculum sp. DA3122]|uniref:hypothetical protein n=1 Tax=unclassified Halalkalibaculum TaxID=2964617 RepID=UPI003754DA45